MTHSKLRRERGSAFMVALAALTILTIIGLSLAMVSETEMLLGANEWVITETHFAAEAGANTQIAKLLVANDTSETALVIPSYFGDLNTQTQIGFDVRTTGLLGVAIEEMPYSKANEGTDGPYSAGFFYTLVRAQRTAWPRNEQVPTCEDLEKTMIGQKHISTGFYFGPMAPPSAEALVNVERQAEENDAEDDILPDDITQSRGLCEMGNSVFSLVDVLNKSNNF